MAATITGTIVLPSGQTTRLVDEGLGVTPRYFLEYADKPDAMGIMRWFPAPSFTPADVIAILQHTGFIQ